MKRFLVVGVLFLVLFSAAQVEATAHLGIGKPIPSLEAISKLEKGLAGEATYNGKKYKCVLTVDQDKSQSSYQYYLCLIVGSTNPDAEGIFKIYDYALYSDEGYLDKSIPHTLIIRTAYLNQTYWGFQVDDQGHFITARIKKYGKVFGVGSKSVGVVFNKYNSELVRAFINLHEDIKAVRTSLQK